MVDVLAVSGTGRVRKQGGARHPITATTELSALRQGTVRGHVRAPRRRPFTATSTAPVVRGRVRVRRLSGNQNDKRWKGVTGTCRMSWHVGGPEHRPLKLPERVTVVGYSMPLLPVDRQSFIVRLGGIDCRVHLWWQPSDEDWYMSLEKPVNFPVIVSRRVTVNSGLLKRLPDILPGDIVCRGLGQDHELYDPRYNAWSTPTHTLRWEPRANVR